MFLEILTKSAINNGGREEKITIQTLEPKNKQSGYKKQSLQNIKLFSSLWFKFMENGS